MSMHVLPNANGVKIYNVNIGKSLPEWLSQKKKKSLRYDEGMFFIPARHSRECA
jgi:hypothetical protein